MQLLLVTTNQQYEIGIKTTHFTALKREYYEQLYTQKFANLEEMDLFLQNHKLPKFNWDEIHSHTIYRICRISLNTE